jgi:hypothetical protein
MNKSVAIPAVLAAGPLGTRSPQPASEWLIGPPLLLLGGGPFQC